MGNILRFSTLGGLKFQPEVQAYLRAVNDAAADWDHLSPTTIDQRVRAIAADRLGPFDPTLSLANAPDPR